MTRIRVIEKRRTVVSRKRRAGFIPPERVRYRERSTVERAFGRLKDEFGRRHVRRHSKVRGHLMFEVVVLTVDALPHMVH